MNLISYAEASEIKGVSRQGIRGLSKKKWGFMVEGQVDISHPDWKCYLAGIDPGTKSTKKTSTKKSKTKSQHNASNKKSAKKKSITKQKASGKQTENKRKGPKYDLEKFDNFVPQTLRELKTHTEIQKMNIEIHVRLGELIDRKIVESKNGKIGQSIQSNFVDLARRVSPRITAKLKAIGMEKEVEKIIGGEVQKGLQAMKNEVMDVLK